jgi:predicted nucleic acid-binding protein
LIYLDTGCLVKLYVPEPESRRVAGLVTGQVISFVLMHELELANALELKLFRKEVKRSQVRAAAALVEADLRAGVLHKPAIVWEDVLGDARTLARAHTSTLGCRSLDIVHCAAARRLSATAFITTDARQRRLAMAIGLACPSV